MPGHIIIGGAPRSGKTTLARRLNREKGLSVISGDFLVSAFEGIFPELGIRHGESHRPRTCERVFPFMKAYMWLHSDWERRPFVMDTTHITPRQVAANGLADKYKVVYMAYPRISAQEKLSRIRRHAAATGDWTRGVSDKDLLPVIEDMIALSRDVEEQCAQCRIPFYDTSEDLPAALDRAYAYLDGQQD